MDTTMDEYRIRALTKEFAKELKTEKIPNQFTRILKKTAVEAALENEMNDHLGYEKHAPEGRGSGIRRNGSTRKHLKGDIGDVDIEAPLDRNASFESQLINK